MAHVLVTGANGFIGSRVARQLAQSGHDVRGVDLAGAGETDWGTVIRGDVCRPEGWRDELTWADVVVHTAALVTNAMTHPDAWWVNVVAPRDVAAAAAQAGVEHFVHLSSIAVLSFLNEHSDRWLPADRLHGIDEELPLMPSGFAYGDSKIAAERALLDVAAHTGMALTIVRPADVYGPGSRPWVIEPLQMIARRQLVLPAGGRGTFTPVHVDDLTRGITATVERPEARGETFFIGGAHGVSCADYFAHLWRMAGRRGTVPTLPASITKAGAVAASRGARLLGRSTELSTGTISMLLRDYTVSNAKAQRLLGWSEQVTLEDGMAGVQAWARAAGLLNGR